MVKNHLKRLTSPKCWKLKRKSEKFVVRPMSGGHNLLHSMPISLLFKNVLKVAKTTKEVKFILNDKEVTVNGKRKKDHKLPVGLFDIVQFPKLEKSYLITIDSKGKIDANEISKNDANHSLSKVTTKRLYQNKTVVGLHNGWNIFVDEDIKTFESVLIDLRTKKITEIFKLQTGAPVLLIGGKHIGHQGLIQKINQNVIDVKIENKTIKTPKAYVFVLGKDKPIIQIK